MGVHTEAAKFTDDRHSRCIGISRVYKESISATGMGRPWELRQDKGELKPF